MQDQNNEQVLINKKRIEQLLTLEKVLNEQGHFFNILRIAKSKTPSALHIFEYGAIICYQNERILYPTHYAGLFSILSTSMWTIIDSIEQFSLLPTQIDTTFTMMHFKDGTYDNNHDIFFERPNQNSLTTLAATSRLKEGRFDNRGNYNDIYEFELGDEWCHKFVDTYMTPTKKLQDRIEFFDNKYKIKSKKTLVVCYRGTDREIKEDSDEKYIELAKDIFIKNNIEQLIIQTEQIQIRQLFKNIFGDRCIWIEELPGTMGSVAMHFEKQKENGKDEWSMNLVAMAYALSSADSILTYTGNIGLYLALFGRIKGKNVYQLR